MVLGKDFFSSILLEKKHFVPKMNLAKGLFNKNYEQNVKVITQIFISYNFDRNYERNFKEITQILKVL